MKKISVALQTTLFTVALLLMVFGCGGKKAEDSSANEPAAQAVESQTEVKEVDTSSTAAEKVAEKLVEQAVGSGGEDVDVKIDENDKTFSMTVTDENNKQSTMTVSATDDSSQMNMSGPDGTLTMQSGTGTKVPENFPKDVLLYPGMTIQMVMENTGPAFSVVGTTTDTIDDVAAFYKKTCPEKGWNQTLSAAQAGDASMLTFEKEERTLMVLVALENGVVNINLNTGIN